MYIFYLKANRYFGYILSDHATPPPSVLRYTEFLVCCAQIRGIDPCISLFGVNHPQQMEIKLDV